MSEAVAVRDLPAAPVTGPVSPQAGGTYGVTCPCSCCADRAAQLAAGRIDAIGYCSCAGYPSEERCDCPVCIQAADGRDDTTRRALFDAVTDFDAATGAGIPADELADALLPVVQQLIDQARADELRQAATDWWKPGRAHRPVRDWLNARADALAQPCPAHSHGGDGWHCAVKGQHEGHAGATSELHCCGGRYDAAGEAHYADYSSQPSSDTKTAPDDEDVDQ